MAKDPFIESGNRLSIVAWEITREGESLRGETQQLVANDIQGAFAALVDRVAPLVSADAGLATWGWIAVAAMLFAYALLLHPAGRSAKGPAAARPVRTAFGPRLQRR